MSLTIADLMKVYVATFDARTKWRNTLLLLGVTNATVASIGVQYRENPDECYREGLVEWLNSGTRHWRDMVEALSSPVVGHKDMAKKIETDYIRSESNSLNSDGEDVVKGICEASCTDEVKTDLLVQAMIQSKNCETSSLATQVKEATGLVGDQLTLKRRRVNNMPIEMGGTVQCVAIGEAVYVGGGEARTYREKCTVMKLDLQQDEWTKLVQYNIALFAMTSLHNLLVLIGGFEYRKVEESNLVAVYESDEWTHPYPPLNIARHSSTAVSYNNHIIVAGGWYTTSVEVFDVESRRWYIAEPLPCKRFELKSTLQGDTLYLMGGKDITAPTMAVHKVDLNHLIDDATSISKACKQASTTLWQTIEDTPLAYSTPLAIGGHLLAISGDFTEYNKLQPGIELKHIITSSSYAISLKSSPIYLYLPETRRWVKVEDLCVLYNCACALLNGEIFIAGGDPFSNSAYFISLSDSL